MEYRLFLLKQLIDVGDVVKLVMVNMMFILSDFEYGRMYQLVIDKTRNIGNSRHRIYHCQSYMDLRTFEETVIEAYSLMVDFRIEIDEKHRNDSFYFGRCVQFILDSDNAVSLESLLNKEEKVVMCIAHYIRELGLLPQDGEQLPYEKCDECESWIVGSNRCVCGNRRCDIVQTTYVQSLDETDVLYYLDSW